MQPNFQTLSGQNAYASPPTVVSPPQVTPQPQTTPVAPPPTPTPSAPQTFTTPSGAIVSASGQLITPPTPSKDINITVPPQIPSDTIANAPTSGQVLTKSKTLAGQFQEYQAQREVSRQQLLEAAKPTQEQIDINKQAVDLQKRIRNLDIQTERDVVGLEGQGRGITQSIIGRQQGAVSREAQFERRALASELEATTGRLSAILDSRKTRVDALTSVMNFDQETFNTLINLSNLTKPDVISTGIDKKTGQIYSLVKDPQTGAITQENIGKVTPEEAKLDFLKSYTNANGNEVASFLDPTSNTIVNKELGKAGDKSGAKPINVLDIARYTELYPDAGVTAGDTEAQANAKVQASNSPEAKTRSMVVAAQTNGATYDTVVKEINGDATIKDKPTALSIAKEVYGVQDTATSPIETKIARLKARGILTDADIRSTLVQKYGQQAVNDSSVGSWMDKIGSFLFGK